MRAVNQLGEDVAAFLVTVTDRPTPPGKAMVAMTLGRSVTLTWGPPDDDGGCKIGNYIVEYYRMGWDMWLKAATCRQLNTTLGDLIEGSEYKFRVKAENPYGVSDPGDESETIFIPDPKRGISDPPQRTVDGSEKGSDWWHDRKRHREDGDEAQDEKKARADDGGGGGTPTRKRPPPLSMELEDVSPIPSPVPRASRAPEKTLSLPRTRSAAPGAGRAGSPRREVPQGAGAPEPPKRRNRSVPRRGDSVSPEPDSLSSYLPTTPDEMGVVKGRLYGIHLSTDSVRAKQTHGGIEEVIYPPLPSPRPSPATSPAPSSPSPRHSPRRSPIGGGEVVTKPESNGVLDLRQVEEYANKYEAKLMELERRQRELEERGRQRQLELEREQKTEMDRMRRERDEEKEEQKAREREREKDIGQVTRRKSDAAAAVQNKDGGKTTGAVQGQDRLFPRSEDGSVTGDSSEFLLVLLPNSRAATEEREGSRSRSVDAAALRRSVEGDGEASVAPPMSLSAPELGAIDPDVPFMRNAVSSTELLHERAMARFYQEVAEEEAEKARRRRMSIERRVSLERRLSIERKNRERLKGRMDSVDEDAEEEIPVNFKRFAAARPSDGSAPPPAPDAKPASTKRVMTSEEREQAEFAALRDRLNRVAKDSAEDTRVVRRTRSEEEEDVDDYLEDEEMEEEEDELGEEEEEEDEDSEDLAEDEDMPLEQPEEESEEETYHPRFGGRSFAAAVDDTPPTPPPHRKVSEPELFIPKAETYTTMTEHDNVASVLLTKRHSPVKGDVKPKPILKKRGSVRRNSKSPGSKSPGSKSPRSKSPGPLSPLLKARDKLRHGERRKSTDSQDSDKSEKRRLSKMFKPIKREDDSEPDASPPVKLRSKPDRPPVEEPVADPRTGSGLTVSPEADLGISAAEAARSKRGLAAPRKDSLKDEATNVVISHYSELVRTYGSANKPQQPKYLTYDELRARAETANGSAEAVGPAEPQRAVLSKSSPPPPPQPAQPAPAPAPAAAPVTASTAQQTPEPVATPVTSSSVREDLLARRESRRDPSATRKDPASRREPSSTRREPSAARREASAARREPSVSKRDTSVSSSRRREPSVAREQSVPRRDASLSKRDPSVSRRDGSTSRKRDGSVSRRDGSVVRRSKEALGAVGRDRTLSERSSVHRSHTSVASSTLSDDLRPRTPEEELELVRRAEESVKSTISYATDLGMLVLAVWLFLFSSELLALPVLALLVYRQVKEEVRRRTPAWLVRFTARLRALGKPKPGTAQPAAANL